MKFIFIIIFFIGCSIKTFPVYTIIKSKQIKIADSGFLEEGFGYKKIVIYKAGIKPLEIVVKNSTICFNNKCLDKEKFMKRYFPNYPINFFDNLLSFRCPIKNKCKIKKEKILFKDKNLIILIKKLTPPSEKKL